MILYPILIQFLIKCKTTVIGRRISLSIVRSAWLNNNNKLELQKRNYNSPKRFVFVLEMATTDANKKQVFDGSSINSTECLLSTFRTS